MGNPFDDLGPWSNFSIAGRLLDIYITAINGVSTKWEWQDQKASGSSGSKSVYKGQKLGHPKLTLDAAQKSDFDDLAAIWAAITPKPGQGGSAPAGKAPASTFAIGSPAAQGSSGGTPKPAAGGGFTVPDPSKPDPGTTAKDKADAGPRPPTVAIENAVLAWHGIVAFAAEEWEGPSHQADTGVWRVILTINPQDEPKPAGTGAMGPAKSVGSQFAIGKAQGQGGSTGGAMGGGAAAGAGGV